MNRTVLTILALSAAAAAFLPGRALAQGPIDKMASEIAEASPEILARASEAEAAYADARSDNSLPNPEVGFTRVWGSTKEAGNKLQLDISQGFDWPGAYRAKCRAAASERAAALMEIEAARSDLRLELKLQLLELVYVRQQLSLQRQLLADLQSKEEALLLAFEHGECTILDQKKIQIENYKLSAALSSLTAQEQAICASLRQQAPGTPLDFSEIYQYPIARLLSADEYFDMAKERDPAFLALKLSESTAVLQAKAASQARMPGFSVGYEHQSEAGERFNGFTLGMTLPVFENRCSRAAALIRKEGASQQAQALLEARLTEITQLIAQAQSYRQQIDMYYQVFGDNAYLSLLDKACKGGEITVLDYLGEVQFYREATAGCISAEYNYAVAIARLNRFIP